MFSGVGCFSIIIAKHAVTDMVYSIDLNPFAIELMKENIRLNKVVDRVLALYGDARSIIEGDLTNIADRVLMPLPEKAYDYIDTALLALKPRGGWVHYQDFVFTKQGDNPAIKSVERLSTILNELKVNYQIPSSRIIRSIGPRWYQTALDVQIFSYPK
jgi:tRNA (guanine37-N1)-methyltransferase